jgi:hypothetical protein
MSGPSEDHASKHDSRVGPRPVSDVSSVIGVQTASFQDKFFALVGSTDGFGPTLALEVQDVDGFRYYVQWWRTPLDVPAEVENRLEGLIGSPPYIF